MHMPECVALTRAMANSGDTLNWPAAGIDGPIVDKHSTGGVGDKVSLILAPLIAACGAFVPMISGRGLGHTGGTLDKLDSIPGYNSTPDRQRFIEVVRTTGCAIIGQTAELAPADKRFYAIRDITATVESIPLITASILSKKLAAGLDALVMDVKFGSGAFMSDIHSARQLAQSITTVASSAGTPTTTLLTDMNQVLGHSVGNALEVREAVEFLNGTQRETRLDDVTRALAADMLLLAGLADSVDAGLQQVDKALANGRAADKFAQMVAELGGPADFLSHHEHYLPAAPVTQMLCTSRTGFIASIDTRAIGLCVLKLGGGRRSSEQGIDHAVGLSELCQLGDTVQNGQVLAKIHARNKPDATLALKELAQAIVIRDEAPAIEPIVRERITA
jgi:thymidine phosphorylase